jgi:hypothetical protein
MKLKLSPSFSTTYVKNQVNSKITVDTSYKRIISAASFSMANGSPCMTINVEHPLQEGHTTYFLEASEDIQKALDYCNANDINIHKLQ